uniref:Uncharacterized protein n=1 Tax=Avena sativa TaxID=4498 RepID=A0ACD5U279_AVESA
MEPTAAAAAIPRGGAFGRVSVARGVQGPRRVVRAALVRPVRGRPRVLVAALPEPLAQEVAAVLELEADKVQVQGGVASAEISSPPAVGTVRVRFVLREQCTFGQSFHLVGEDPALGLWELANAVALDWSEGHDWTVEKDLPANRLVEFKFLLRDSSGKFRWQDGPNRSLQTGETTKTLVVYDDWSDEKNQKVVEEGDAPVEMVEAVVADDDNSINDVVLANELQLEGNQEIKEDESSTIGDDENSTVAASASIQGEPANACEADQPESVIDEQKIQDELSDEVDTAPENGSATTYVDDYSERTDDGSILSKDGVLVKNEWTTAVERELLWGWKALQQLLGFKMDTT